MSFFTSLQRILQSGFTNFFRNGFVTVAAILVMTVTLFVMISLIFLGDMLDHSLAQIEDQVDVNVYFTTDASEENILSLQRALESEPAVESVTYISRQQALENFQERHQDEDLIIQALEELDENPLGAHFNVRAVDTSRYGEIADFLESNGALAAAGGESIVNRVNFAENQATIDRLNNIITSVDAFGLIVIIVFMAIAILIVFNTIRLAIYTARDEISVMKLVGASNAYIRGPFVIEGILYGIVSALLALLIFYPVSIWVGPSTESFFGAINAFDYYVNNFPQMFVALLAVGAALGALSSWLAVRRYLNI